jgi:hypothetical protein
VAEYTRTITVGKAEIGVTFQSLPFRLWSRLDDMTSQMFFEQGGRRTGTNMDLGRIKDIVVYNAVKPDSKGRRRVTFKHPEYNDGEKKSITLGDPMTFDTFPAIDSDYEYMAELPEAFMREILTIFRGLYMRYGILWRGILSEEEEAQADEDPTESEETDAAEDSSTSEHTSTGAPSNAL